MKWLGYLVIAITIVGIASLIYLKLMVGAVNAPFGQSEVGKDVLIESLQVPQGFSVSIFAEVENARILRFSPGGHLLVANPNLDRVTILEPDANDDGLADHQRILIDGLNGPNGLDFYQDWLYIAETDAIGRVRFNSETGQIIGDYQRIVTGLPAGENHWKKTLKFGPDGLLYVSMGSSCNVCIEADERRAAMVRYQPDGSGEQIVAKGLRNSAGFDWSPISGELYATDNGRDLLGDEFPPCELNRIVEGAHYGWPFANGNNIPDPDFGEHPNASHVLRTAVVPAFNFRAHNAPLGMEFVKGDSFPQQFRGAALVALHGSWNRREKDGYKVVSLHWDSDGQVSSRDFLWGMLEDDAALGRPTELTQGPDGAFYISDDYANVIYRVAYGEEPRRRESHNHALAPRYSAVESLGPMSAEELAHAKEQGEALFKRFQCVSCHADNGRSLKTLESLGSKYNLDTLSEYLRRPRPPMPVFPLSDEDREALAVYLIDRYPES